MCNVYIMYMYINNALVTMYGDVWMTLLEMYM